MAKALCRVRGVPEVVDVAIHELNRFPAALAGREGKVVERGLSLVAGREGGEERGGEGEMRGL